MTETEAMLLEALKKYETDLMSMLEYLEKARKAEEQIRKETESEIISVLQNFGERLEKLEINYSTLQEQIMKLSAILVQQSETQQQQSKILTQLTKA